MSPRLHQPADEAGARAFDGRATLAGLVAGSATASVVGTVLVAVGCLRAGLPPAAGVAFTGVTGLVMLLRSRTYVDTSPRGMLLISGLLCATTAFAIVVAWAPRHV